MDESTTPQETPPCPRCGQPTSWAGVGRKPLWCSQPCRRAAYEERRAAASGAIAVRVVEAPERPAAAPKPVKDSELLADAVRRVLGSPRACREVVEGLGAYARSGVLESGRHHATRRALLELVHDLDERRLLD
jgi:endogenous inhibitor of DNA gyrase (YacG/DUF329 family)